MKNKDMGSLLLTKVSRYLLGHIFAVSVIFTVFHSISFAQGSDESVDVSNFVFLGVTIVFIILAVGFWRWSLNKEVAKRTANFNEEGSS